MFPILHHKNYHRGESEISLPESERALFVIIRKRYKVTLS